MSPSRPKSNSADKNITKKKKNDLTKDELGLLEELCSSTEYDEISFDEWRDCHNSLDLVITVNLEFTEAKRGTKKMVSWTRTLFQVFRDGAIREKRESITKEIEFPPGVNEGHTIILSGMGDQKKDFRGDVKVIVRII